MKKTSLLLLFLMTISTVTFARLKEKQIVGKWKYEITLSNAQLEGSFVFNQKDGKLEGKNIQSDGNIPNLSNIKVNKKNETLCFNLLRETDIPIEFILTVTHNKFRGKGWISDADFEITGEKFTVY